MGILSNAVDSITLGLEDYGMPDPRRKMSATRNLFAGILLLFKYKLVLLSPDDSDEVLIKQKVLPTLDNNSDEIVWIGKGKKTVDVMSIQERFNSLKIKVDWSRIEAIQKYRNDIEHYHSIEEPLAVESMISNCFIVIRDFIKDELDWEPSELLGLESWNILLNVSEVYQKEKIACVEGLEGLSYDLGDIGEYIFDAFKNAVCPRCKSGLVTTLDPVGTEVIDAKFICKSCDNPFDYEVIGEFLSELYDVYSPWDFSHSSIVDSNLTVCPSCSETAYFMNENMCAVCFSEFNTECMDCTAQIPVEEFTDEHRRCGYCAYKYDKMMRE